MKQTKDISFHLSGIFRVFEWLWEAYLITVFFFSLFASTYTVKFLAKFH